MQALNPTTAQVTAEYADHTPPQIDEILALSAAAFEKWRRLSIDDRAPFMRRLAAALRARKDELAKLMADEMGKPIGGGEQEVEKCAACCEHYAQHAADYLKPEAIESDAARSYVRFDPIGPVLAIMPWNFPLWQVFRFAAPTLMAGNVGLLKHAENVPGCALAIARAFYEAGFPPGVFSVLMIDRKFAEGVIKNPVVRAVTLTGSERAGRAVAEQAGSVLKKTVLELGGSDPFIVLTDVDVEAVAKRAAEARCINSGQSCIAAKRFIVEAAIYEPFVQAMTAAMKKMKTGDPHDRATQIGPQARGDLRENLHRQVRESIAAGARLTTGGAAPAGPGFFYPPTVLADVTPGMAAFDEETFGPVAAIIRARDADDAIALANRSSYGLGASIWTKNTNRAELLAAAIETGCVFVNGIVKSDVRLPFGGVKNSGYGRELSAFGIREFVNMKTVWVK